jgi:hypothetical protein
LTTPRPRVDRALTTPSPRLDRASTARWLPRRARGRLGRSHALVPASRRLTFHPQNPLKPPETPQVYIHWLTQLRYLSAVYFGFHAVAANEFDGVLLPCTGGGTADGSSVSEWIGDALPNTSNQQRRQLEAFFGRYSRAGDCVFDPSSTLAHYDVSRPYWANAGVLIGYLGIMHALTFGAMLITTRRERR